MKTPCFLLMMVFLMGASPALAAFAARDVRSGNALYHKGDYSGAREKYQEALKGDPESVIINFNLGTAFYKNNDFEKAARHLEKALLSDDLPLKNDAHFNLGNAYFRLGLSREEDNLEQAIEFLERSLAQYDRVLRADDKDEDARHNQAVTKKELERLKEKMKRQQQSPQGQCPRSTGNGSPDDPSRREQQQDRQNQEQPGQDRESGEQNTTQDSRPDNSERQPDQERQNAPPQPSGQEQQEDRQSAARDHSVSRANDAMTPEEAQRLLDHYQQTEEPRGLLNLAPQKGTDVPVLKDW